jgi:hypothetical protein
MVVRLAPDLLGFNWRLALIASLHEAVLRKTIPLVMREYVEARLS